MAARPGAFILDICRLCGTSCVYCPVHQKGARRSGKTSLMPTNVAEKIIIDARSAHFNYVCLYMTGEPLLHPEFLVILETALRYGMNVGLATKLPVQLTKDWDSELRLAEGLRQTIDLLVTVDAATQRTQRLMSTKLDCERVWGNIRIAREWSRRWPLSLRLSAKTVVTGYNVHELPEIERRMRELGVLWKPKGVGTMGGPLSLSSRELASLVRGVPSKYRRFVSDNGKVSNRAPKCPFGTPAVGVSGELLLCCHDMSYSLPQGNVLDVGLKTLLDSESYRLSRKKAEARELEMCSGCS